MSRASVKLTVREEEVEGAFGVRIDEVRSDVHTPSSVGGDDPPTTAGGGGGWMNHACS